MSGFAAFLTAALASFALTPLVLRAASRYGLYDVPREARRVHRAPVPRLGGVAVFAGVLLAVGAGLLVGAPGFAPADGSLLPGLFAGAALLFGAGLYDDVRGLGPVPKLGLQVCAALVVYVSGTRVELLSLGPDLEVALGSLSLPLTILWIVGVTNAFNLIDGLDGLATGIGIVALATILVVAHMLGHGTVVVVAAALCGSLVGFIRYNFSPARIFLGDCGSLVIGFMLAVLSVHGSIKSATALVVVVPLFALAVPILDVTFAIARRWLRGTPVLGADARHIHHRLLDLGLDHGRASLTLYAVAAVLAIVGLAVAFAPPAAVARVAVAGGLGMLALFIYGMHRLQYTEFIEAGTVLASGFSRIRRVVRDQIHASDLAGRIARAQTLDQVEQLVGREAAQFGFIAMEICHEGIAGPDPASLFDQAWKLEYPLHPFRERRLVLRVWCPLTDGSRPYGAERVARLIGPAVDARLRDMAAVQEEPNPDVVPLRGLSRLDTPLPDARRAAQQVRVPGS